MKKLIYCLLVVAISILCIVERGVAGGPALYNINLTASGPVIADSNTTMTISLHAYEYRCSVADPISHYYLNPDDCAANGYGTATEVAAGQSSTANTKISASGDGVTLSASTVSPDANGNASFTVKSSVAGVKTISATYAWETSPVKTIQVTFTAPVTNTTSPTVTPKSTTTTTPKTTPAPTTTTAPATVQNPAAPSLAEVKIGNTITTTPKPTISSSEPLVLAGKTVPSGIVTLTIHSTPRTVTATADKDGNWNYSILDLEPGDHYIEAKVTDPTTNKTSDPVKILSFSVTQAQSTPKATTTGDQPKQAHDQTKLVGVALLLLGVGIVIAWFVWRYLQKKRKG